jgi:hypothetical protein
LRLPCCAGGAELLWLVEGVLLVAVLVVGCMKGRRRDRVVCVARHQKWAVRAYRQPRVVRGKGEGGSSLSGASGAM